MRTAYCPTQRQFAGFGSNTLGHGHHLGMAWTKAPHSLATHSIISSRDSFHIERRNQDTPVDLDLLERCHLHRNGALVWLCALKKISGTKMAPLGHRLTIRKTGPYGLVDTRKQKLSYTQPTPDIIRPLMNMHFNMYLPTDNFFRTFLAFFPSMVQCDHVLCLSNWRSQTFSSSKLLSFLGYYCMLTLES